MARVHPLRRTIAPANLQHPHGGGRDQDPHEWMDHRDFNLTLIYADYQPAVEEAALVERAFSRSGNRQGVSGAGNADPEPADRG